MREDITVFIKMQTYKKKERFRKRTFTLQPKVEAGMIFEKRNSKNKVINFCAKISVRANELF